MLTEILPYINKYYGHLVVVKYGGHAMVNPDLARVFARDIVLLRHMGIRIIVVHGGGPQINKQLEKHNITPQYHQGLRVTDPATMEVVEMTLTGLVNKQIVAAINSTAGNGIAVGLSGRDANLLEVSVVDPQLGLVGTPHNVNASILASMIDEGYIPVIAPVGSYVPPNQKISVACNVNADTAAGAIARAMQAKRLLLLTDVDGVLDSDGALIARLNSGTARGLIESGVVKGGMIPKVETCLTAIDTSDATGVEAAVILDGREQHSVLLELFTDIGLGTLVSDAPDAEQSIDFAVEA